MMARNSTPQMTPQWRQPRTLYLTLYNTLFLALWSSIFIRTISHVPLSKTQLFAATEPQARWTQTLSLIEVLHSATGKANMPSHIFLHSVRHISH
jgi:very-long-chain (3R)-3-hydroxyacyl-CoA dehydratase